MAMLPTVSMKGWDAVGKALQELVLKSVVSRLEREGVKIFSPCPVVRERPKPVICSNRSIMGVEENPCPATAPQFIFLFAGEGLVFVRETWYRLTTGQGVFVPCNCPCLPRGMLDNLVPGGVEGNWSGEFPLPSVSGLSDQRFSVLLQRVKEKMGCRQIHRY
ncbi:MAG: hypothetical protein ACUVRR_00840 [Candidatus Fervidibacter sp.]|uniref:hypothetical protein n=1 Tax=Candidatus Fervidibacter sp. TaxID=3100871 RepID=UPI00404A9A3C